MFCTFTACFQLGPLSMKLCFFYLIIIPAPSLLIFKSKSVYTTKNLLITIIRRASSVCFKLHFHFQLYTTFFPPAPWRAGEKSMYFVNHLIFQCSSILITKYTPINLLYHLLSSDYQLVVSYIATILNFVRILFAFVILFLYLCIRTNALFINQLNLKLCMK